MSTTEHTPADTEVEDYEGEVWEQEQPISRRPRRRLLTPLTALLFAVLVGAGGFIAGVQVEKGEVSSSPAGGSGRGAGRLADAGFGGGVPGAGGAGATVGQVAYVSGSDLFVTNLQGNTVKVATAGAKVTRQMNSSVRVVHPGDTVIVQGTTHSNGSLEAVTIRDTPGSGGGEPALFGK